MSYDILLKGGVIYNGAGTPGVRGDVAVQGREKITAYLQQSSREPVTLDVAKRQLFELCAWLDQLEKVLKAQAAKPAGQQRVAAAAR